MVEPASDWPSTQLTLIESADSIRVSTDVDEGEWDGYVSGHPDATVDHLWRWREIFRTVFGHDAVYLAARRGHRVVGVLPLVRFRSSLFGKFVVSLPFLNYGGVLADNELTGRALVDHAIGLSREFGAAHLELRHTRRHFPELPCRTHKVAMTRPLPSTVDELWKTTDRKVRNQVRKAQKEGLVVEAGGAERVAEFYGVFARNMRDLGTPVYSRRLFEETIRLFPERARVYVVRHGAAVLAAAVALRFQKTLLVPWASSLREYRYLCPNMLLYWEMHVTATEDGLRTFDFGRSSPGGGTQMFKAQWGARETPLYWEYVLFGGRSAPNHGLSNPRFRRAIQLWKRMPLGLSLRIGPALARHFG